MKLCKKINIILLLLLCYQNQFFTKNCTQQCKQQPFSYFNQDKILLPGTMDQPGAAQRFKKVSLLKPYEIEFLNIVHWVHHLFEKEKTYDYLKQHPVTIYYKGNPITLTTWNLDHVFVGDIYPNNTFVTGMHYDHQGVKDFYHYTSHRGKGYISHPGNLEYNKMTKLFPKHWNSLKIVKKVTHALQKRHLHIQEQDGKLRIKTMIDNMQVIIVIKPHGDINKPTTGTVITFYPRYV